MTRPLPSLGLTAALVLAAGCDVRVDTLSQPPRPEIASHDPDETVEEGVPTLFRGTVGDPDSKPEVLSAWWTVDGEPACDEAPPGADGRAFCEARLTVGRHEVALFVRDEAGGVGTATVTVWGVPTAPPTARILEPDPAARYYEDRLIPFAGVVADLEDRADLLEVWWEVDGVRRVDIDATPDSAGRVAGVGLVAAGESHAVRLAVRDTSGKTGEDSIPALAVQPTNTAPTCAITTPAPASSSAVGDPVSLTGTAADINLEAPLLAATWRSDLDGLLAEVSPNGAGLVQHTAGNLSVGTHTLTLEVADDLGALCTASVIYVVGARPQIGFQGPPPDSSFSRGQFVRFVARVSDADDPASAISVRWTSSLQGELGSSRPDSAGFVELGTSALFGGAHVITAEATDPLGLTRATTLPILINVPPTAPVIEISPVEPFTDDPLEATIAVQSQDTDPVTYAWQWYRNGDPVPGQNSPTVPATATRRDEIWRVEVTPTDGRDQGPVGTASVVVSNSMPQAQAPQVQPAPLFEGLSATCVTSPGMDADSDPVSLAINWTVNGAPIPHTGPTLDGSDFSKGDAVACAITPTDGAAVGAPAASAPVAVLNTPPEVADVQISPDPAQSVDELRCTWRFEDEDGDPDLSEVRWTVDGAEAGTGPTLAGAFTEDSEVQCRVRARDGESEGNEGSAQLSITPSTPIATNVRISPAAPTLNDSLTCTYTFSDPQGDANASTIAWFIGPNRVATGPALAAGEYVKHDMVRCEVTPSDGRYTGVPVSATVEIANTPPTTPVVVLYPEQPVSGAEDLHCDLVIGFEASDADGDPVSYRILWTRDGAPFTGAEDTGVTSTVPAAAIGPDEEWICYGHAFDGEELGAPHVESTIAQEGAGFALDAGFTHACRLGPSGAPECWGNVNAFANGPTVVKALAVGYDNTCGLSPQDEIVCWGARNTAIMPPNVPPGQFARVELSVRAACAYTEAGASTCWGSLPTPPAGVTWRSLQSGFNNEHACGIRAADGGLQCWGANTRGESTVPPALAAEAWAAVAVGEQFTCGVLESSGRIHCWGFNDARTTGAPADTGWEQLSTGRLHGCALRAGQVRCWGLNSHGQVPASLPAAVSAAQGSFIAVTAGRQFNCVHTAAGQTLCWGDNSFGQATPP